MVRFMLTKCKQSEQLALHVRSGSSVVGQLGNAALYV